MWSDNESSRDSVVDLTDSPPLKTKKRKRETLTSKPVPKKASSSQWVTSAFGDFDDFAGFGSSTQPAAKTKQSKLVTKPLSQCPPRANVSKRPSYEDELWSDKHTPKSVSDLAVHKKKIEELQTWLQRHLNSKTMRSPMVLLTGPAGAGKSALVQVLAKELNCELKEWSNPIAAAYDELSFLDRRNNWSDYSRVEGSYSSSQLSQFQQFLLRADKYNSLDIFGNGTQGKVILVEEFPNIVYKDATSFHDILRKYSKVGRCPLIFIISDSSSGESNERLLFPKHLQEELHIENISFNPIAATTMLKFLTKIATEEAAHGMHKFSIPSKAVIESISMSSAGDIRGAINALQFACLKDTHDLLPTTSKGRQSKKKTSGEASKSKRAGNKSSADSDSTLAAIGGRDTSLFLFRALGKILYCKRDDPSNHPELAKLPPHLREHERDPLSLNPEDVIEKCNLSGDYFNAYLHQNYLEFFSEISDVVRASEYLSDSDFMTFEWSTQSILEEYASSIATRGMLHSNSSRSKHSSTGSGLGWKPLHKPQWYSTCKTERQNCETARHLFKSYACPPDVLQTELVPFLSLIDVTLHDPGQISFINEITKFSNVKIRSEKLDEKDLGVDKDSQETGTSGDTVSSNKMEEDNISNSQSKVVTEEMEEEEEYEITEFDD
ncbi:cell cycle checkpoint protein RAD17-like isoform X8 [Crassostrea angulata]|uniref:cell cycle checkpoint protein RAD17-like isoform X8 n=1 Tax=Magallana angulata TaxID=2784310 RepID=UPI0022B0F179|nr:cell cycle checkpoint protein RAD17-like isoform X8 [Crassostrea angulata]